MSFTQLGEAMKVISFLFSFGIIKVQKVLPIQMSAINKSATSDGGFKQCRDENGRRIAWNVRPTAMADQEPVSRLLHNCYSTLLPLKYSQDVLSAALPLISQARPELLTSGAWYVAEHPDTLELVGCGGWSENVPTGGSMKQDDGSNHNEDISSISRAHLRHFASDPALQRQGIASAIWKRIREDILQKLGQSVDEIQIEVYSTLTAIPFYDSLGFQEHSRIDLTLGENCAFPIAIMRRPKQL